MSIELRETPAPETLLQRHAHRSIRAFLRGETDDRGANAVAFWDLVYQGHVDVTIAQARLVADELIDSPRTVRDLLDGWRPTVLTAPSEVGSASVHQRTHDKAAGSTSTLSTEPKAELAEPDSTRAEPPCCPVAGSAFSTW